MSLFENYPREMSEMDQQVRHYAAICGIDPADRPALDLVMHDHASTGARATLRGLLILRLKVEAGMLDAGLELPPEDQ